MALKPLLDNILVEVDKLVGYEELSESVQNGIVAGVPVTPQYISGNGWILEVEGVVDLESMVGKRVYWKQFADKESTVEEGDKVYALIRISDLVAVEDE